MFLHSTAVLGLVASASAEVITVTVGAGDFIYTPNSVTAQVGDIVNFQFTGAPGNHTVSQAAFDQPCEQLYGGFDSGPVPVPESFVEGPPPEWNLTITSTDPIWYYCKSMDPLPHCIAGMVGAINAPTSGNTFDAWTNVSRALTALPEQSPGSLSGIGASATATPSPLVGSPSNSSITSTTASHETTSATGATTASRTSAPTVFSSSAPSGSTVSSVAASTSTGSNLNSATSVVSGTLWSLFSMVLGIALT